MKIDWNKKHTTIAVYAFIVIASSIIFYLIMSSLDGFTRILKNYIAIIYPFIYGFVLAYLVNYPLKFFTKQLSKIKGLQKVKKSIIHVLALILAYIFSALLVYLFIGFVLPQLIFSVTGLVKNIPNYIRSTSDYLDSFMNGILIPEEIMSFVTTIWDDIAVSINELSAGLIPFLLSFVSNIAQSFINIFLGIIISIYMLSEKERFLSLAKKLNYGVFSQSVANWVMKLSRRSHNIFNNFLGGKILDSAIVGVIAFIVLSIMKMPYALLVSFIVGITNIIPFFGPFIGAIPSFLIIFFESPTKALWFLVFILILQQVDGNIIGPKILGDSLGISSFWILFSVIVSGKILGFIGMVIGVPLFVFIYSIVKDIVEERLKSKGLPVDTEEYLNM